MRVLLIRPGPSFSVQDVAFGWRDGLRECGVQVADCNYDDRLDFFTSVHINKGVDDMVPAVSRTEAVRLAAQTIRSDCFDWWPTVIIIVSGMFVPLDTVDIIRNRGIKVVYLNTESPYEDDRQLVAASHADLVILNDPTNLETFRALNPETYYVPHAYDPKRHHPGPGTPEMASEFCFVGTGFGSRVEFFEACDFDGLDVVLGGAWPSLPDESPLNQYLGHRKDWCMDNAETAEAYRSTKSSLNLYRREFGHDGTGPFGGAPSGPDTADGWACGPREIELAACGTFFLRDPRPESDELFPMLPTFSEPAEVRPLLDWWLAHDTEREEAALKARAAIEDRTFRNNAAWFLEHLDRS